MPQPTMKELFSCLELLQYLSIGDAVFTGTTKTIASATGGFAAFSVGETFVCAASGNNTTFTIATIASTNSMTVVETVTLESAEAATFTQQVTSSWMDGTPWKNLRGTVNASQACTVYIEQSQDGVNVVSTRTFTILAGVPLDFVLDIVARKFRVRILNGTTNQTAFSLFVNGGM